MPCLYAALCTAAEVVRLPPLVHAAEGFSACASLALVLQQLGSATPHVAFRPLTKTACKKTSSMQLCCPYTGLVCGSDGECGDIVNHLSSMQLHLCKPANDINTAAVVPL